MPPIIFNKPSQGDPTWERRAIAHKKSCLAKFSHTIISLNIQCYPTKHAWTRAAIEWAEDGETHTKTDSTGNEDLLPVGHNPQCLSQLLHALAFLPCNSVLAKLFLRETHNKTHNKNNPWTFSNGFSASTVPYSYPTNAQFILLACRRRVRKNITSSC